MPKIKFEKEILIEKVLEIAQEEGVENVTVRKIAQKVGSFVAPLYTAFGNVSETIMEAKELAMKKVS
jgi:AcrR family transcriptional regulator